MSLHQQTHPTFVDGCFGCKAGSIRIAAEATPFRREATVARARAWDKQARDDAAYKKLRADGLQPKGTKDCTELALLDDPLVIQGLPKLWNERQDLLVNPTDTPMTMAEITGEK